MVSNLKETVKKNNKGVITWEKKIRRVAKAKTSSSERSFSDEDLAIN